MMSDPTDNAVVDVQGASALSGADVGRTSGGSLTRRIAHLLPAATAGIVLFVVWELAVRVLGIQEFLLPKPTSILEALADNWSGAAGVGTTSLRQAGWNTSVIAISGLLVGVGLGALLALMVTRFARLGQTLTPFAVAANATPIIALAPIFNAWFGITSPLSNQAVVVVVVFFPVFVNTARGLLEVDPAQLELMRSYGASPLNVIRRVRIPNAIPFFLTSLRLAAPLSVIAAIVAEYFGGPQDRLGPVITQNASFARYDAAWAAIVVASAVGLMLFLVAIAIERLAAPWRRPDDG
ncbi:MAG: ABC transporter permease [Acidimicrobiia bacterium]|nr:ABC transporter permease [Acidimicrobiia bacterium]